MRSADSFSLVAGLAAVVLGLVAAGGGLGPLLDRPERALPVLAVVLAAGLVASVIRRRDGAD